MLEICRVCCESIQGVSTKNLFNFKQTILLHHIELLTGEWLINHQNAPSFICICCEQDLKVSVALRARCIKTQRKLQEENICASPPWEISDQKKIVENSMARPEREDQYCGSKLDCIAEKEADDIKNSVIHEEDFNKEDDNFLIKLSDIKVKKSLPLEDDSAQHLDIRKKTSPEPLVQISDQEKKTNPALSKKKKEMRHFICDQCGRHFSDLGNLKSHLIRHSGIKKYECEICKTRFYSSYLLKRHSLKHKSIQPTFSCQYCDRKYIYNNLRLRHERLHFKERRFQCTYCIKSFFSKFQRKEHELVHTRIRKYYCELCDQHFLRKTHLIAHYRSKAHKKNEQQRK